MTKKGTKRTKKTKCMKDKRTWCQLSDKEAERRNPDGNTPRCGNSHCFDCYGDSCY